MSDFDRVEEARERNEGLYYEEYHERMSAPEEEEEEEDGLADWRYEVANGDTLLGFAEWLDHREEAVKDE